jgi:hypothetical protein
MPALLSALQFFFALTWIVYVIYLPSLAADAGIDRRHVPAILMMDQVVFIACDWAAGVYADRLARLFGRIGDRLAVVTLVSCGAFIAMPWVAPAAGAGAFLAITVIWSATSSALRAPPLVLASRHAPASQQPWLAALFLLGMGIASALAPYLGLNLKAFKPQLPFAVASMGLAILALVLARAERHFEALAPAGEAQGSHASFGALALFCLAMLLFGLGFQVHFSINSAPAYQRLAPASELPYLMPVFWIGFNLAILPAAILPKRFGGMFVLVMGGAAGVAALFACSRAASIEALVAANFVAGAAWSVALMAAFSTALEVGRGGREGLVTGVLFSVLAGAALARIFATWMGLHAQPAFTGILAALPFCAWAAASLIIAVLAMKGRGGASGA